MKYLIIIYTIIQILIVYYTMLLLLVCTTANANSLEFVTTSVTTHPFAAPDLSEKFTHKLALNGRANWTHINGLVYTDENDFFYRSYKGFFGMNSIGEPMVGAALGFGLRSDSSQLGLVTGFYIQNSSEFVRREIDPGITGDVMPIVGIEWNYKWYISKTEFIKLNNMLTPVITNHSIAIGVDF